MNFLAVKCAHERRFYKQIMFNESVDFSELQKCPYYNMNLDELQERATFEGVRKGGTAEELITRLFRENATRKEEHAIDHRRRSTPSTRHLLSLSSIGGTGMSNNLNASLLAGTPDVVGNSSA